MTALPFSPEMMAALLTGAAVFMAMLALMMPVDQDKKFRMRLSGVAREKRKLRDGRLKDLSARTQPQLRRKQPGLFAQTLQRSTHDNGQKDEKLILDLRMAGFRSPGAEAVFVFLRMAVPVLFALIGFALLMLYRPHSLVGGEGFLFIISAAAFGYSSPRLILARLIARRQRRIMRAFPDALDLLLICVQSGLSVEAAMGRVTNDISTQSIELAEELGLTMAELSYLPVRWRAYANLGERIGVPSVKLITAALLQAERHGTSIGQALNSAAAAGRETRIMEAEYKAASLPPRLAIPLVVFFLPVLLTIILGPAIIRGGHALKSQSDQVIERTQAVPKTHRPDARASSNAP